MLVTDFEEALQAAQAELVAERNLQPADRQAQVSRILHECVRSAVMQSFTKLAEAGAEQFTVVTDKLLSRPVVFPGIILSETDNDGTTWGIVGRNGELATVLTRGPYPLAEWKSSLFGRKWVKRDGRRVIEADRRQPQITAWMPGSDSRNQPCQELVGFHSAEGSTPGLFYFQTTADTYDHAQQQLLKQIVESFARMTAHRLHTLGDEVTS